MYILRFTTCSCACRNHTHMHTHTHRAPLRSEPDARLPLPTHQLIKDGCYELEICCGLLRRCVAINNISQSEHKR